MFRTIDDFLESRAYETEAPLRVLQDLTDSSPEQRTSPGGPTLGQVGWHIVWPLPAAFRRR